MRSCLQCIYVRDKFLKRFLGQINNKVKKITQVTPVTQAPFLYKIPYLAKTRSVHSDPIHTWLVSLSRDKTIFCFLYI